MKGNTLRPRVGARKVNVEWACGRSKSRIADHSSTDRQALRKPPALRTQGMKAGSGCAVRSCEIRREGFEIRGFAYRCGKAIDGQELSKSPKPQISVPMITSKTLKSFTVFGIGYGSSFLRCR